jgi:hypothetical protein
VDAEAIIGAVEGVTKKWAKQRKAEERRASARSRRAYVFRQARVTIKDVAYKVMRDAYLKASGGGKLPALARQIMYCARGPIQEETGKPLDDQYFCQTLLPDYIREHPGETAGWDVVFDARGHFEEPHTGEVVPLGTLDVRRYLGGIGPPGTATSAVRIRHKLYPTSGPPGRFGAVLFIEKEGFMPLFKEVELAERYDLAIMSTKGLSVTASRALVDRLCRDVPLLVLRDFDKSGFSIAGTLQRDTRRYEFRNDIRVIDLGLRLSDVEENDLEAEDVLYGKSDPGPNLIENGATREEVDFLCPDAGSWCDTYTGQRVELNAFTSDALIAWLERKLKENGIKKVVPGAATLEIAFRRAAETECIKQLLDRERDAIRQRVAEMSLPDDLGRKLARRLKRNPARPWDSVLIGVVRRELGGDKQA